MNITTRQIKAFLLVAQHRSFSRAAEQMFMTQSGVSVLTRELERQLRFRLFDRTTRYVQLTEHGAQFLAVAEDHLRRLEAVVSGIGQAESEAQRWLSVGAPPMTAANVLPEVIAHFHAKQRKLRVRLVDTDLPHISELVRSGALDMGLGMFIKPTPGLKRIPLFRFSLMVVRRGETRTTRSKTRRWSELAGQAFIGLPPDNPIQQLIARHLQRVGHRQPPAHVVNYLDTLIAMVASGAGIAVVPSSTLPACRNRRIVTEPLIDPIVGLDLYEVRNRGRALPPGAEEFTDFLKDYVAGWAGRGGALS